jgi:hypothetical protein
MLKGERDERSSRTEKADVSERKPQPRRPTPTDFPVARGVSPPPKPVRRAAVPPPLPRTAARPAIAPEFAFDDTNGRVVVRRPLRASRKSDRGWTLGIEIAAVVVLAGFCMAAGWWLFHGPSGAAPPAEQARVESKVTKPTAAAVVAEPPKPAEKPAARVARPPGPPVADAPGSPKPAVPAPPPKPAPPQVTNLTFQRDIFPILKSKCITCHGENKKKLKGGLDVSTVTLLERGGESGPAINRKEPETSRLWETVANGEMPPGKSSKLSESEKKKLHDWIVGGGR